MKRKRLLLATALLVAGTICPLTQIKAETSRVQTLVEGMSIRQKITQMLMPDFRKWKQAGQDSETDFTEMNEEVAEAIDKYDFGGVILFAENVKQTNQTLALTQAMQEAAITNKAGNGNLPLLLTIDQEGGIVYRLGSGTALPGNMAVGATREPELARQAGEIIGRELSALGLNVDFAPVFDTNNNPHNPIIGLRSFSSDPNVVALLGVPMMQGIQEYNVAVAAKHFPGHGDTATDSHTGLPLVDKSYAELEALELLPFKAAIDNGVDMLMTAHIQYPQIEKDTVVSKKSGEKIYIPATLSDDVITGIVRNKFGYNGVVITDAMGMDAIAKNFGESEAAIMAIKAGVDIVLMPTFLRSKADLVKIDTIINDIEQAVNEGIIPESRLNEAVTRVLTLKEKRGVLDFSLADRTLEKATASVGSDMNRDLERTIATSAVTVVKNDDTVLPFKANAGDKVLLLGAYNNELPGLELGMRRLIADGVVSKDVTFESFRYSNQTTIDELKSKIDNATHVIVISEIGRQAQLASDVWLTKIPTEVIDYANETNKKSVVMSISKPYDVANYPRAKAILAVYGNKGMDPTEALKPDNAFGPNIPAGVEVIFDGKEHIGTLPVDVPVVENGVISETEIAYPIGHGLMYTDAIKEMNLSLPETAKVGQKFKATVTLGELNGLEKEDYDVAVKVDTTKFKIVGDKTSDTLVVHKKAMDKSPIEIELVPLLSGVHEPVLSVSVIDKQERMFTKEYEAEMIDVASNIDNTMKTSLSIPEFARVGQKFKATVTLGALNGLEKEDYDVAVKVDTTNFKIEGNETSDTLVVHKKAMDTSPVEVNVIPINNGEYAPILSVTVTDKKDNMFINEYKDEMVRVLLMDMAGVNLSLPETARVGQTFKATVTLGELNGLEKEDYDVAVKVDTTKFKIVENPAYTIVTGTTGFRSVDSGTETTVMIHKKALDVSPIEIELVPLVSGKYAPALSVSVIDKQGRMFTNEYQDRMVSVLPMRMPAVSSTMKAPKEVQQADVSTKGKYLPKTGEQSVAIYVGLLFVGMAVLVRKKAEDK
ncbi:beta-hexosaminidase [Carnobacteriaceae bacterium zg-ZUI78]|nr:beta-hexosaminidase [Carnobacteriaceae bacterium zg-ZUI78]